MTAATEGGEEGEESRATMPGRETNTDDHGGSLLRASGLEMLGLFESISHCSGHCWIIQSKKAVSLPTIFSLCC